MKALLVDDEPLARKRLRTLLHAHRDLDVAGEASNVEEAAALVREIRPDVIFLDIQMPRKNGFELLPLLAPPLPRIIFVTAFHQYAVRAFEVNAVDYLLKPVDPDRLRIALERVPSKPAPLPGFTAGDSVLLTDAQRVQLTPLARIAAIEAEGNYSRVHLVDDAPMMVLRGIGSWVAAVPQPPFLRADRSLLIQLPHFERLTKHSRDASVLSLRGVRREFELGRAASARLRAALRS